MKQSLFLTVAWLIALALGLAWHLNLPGSMLAGGADDLGTLASRQEA